MRTGIRVWTPSMSSGLTRGTAWHYRERLAQAGVIETLFEDFDGHLEQQGYLAMGGQIIDGEPLERHWSERQWRTIVPVPKQRNSRDENARIKEGETPEGWENQPAKRSQKGECARAIGSSER